MNGVQEAKSLLESGQLEEAAEAYERLCTAQPETWEFWLNLAYCYSALENHGKAITSARRAFELAPDESVTRSNLAAILIDAAMLDPTLSEEQRRDFALEGVRLCDQLLTNDQDNTRVLYNKANGLSVLGEHQEAKKILQAVVKLAPQWDDALVNLGNSLKSLGRSIEALDWYKRVLERTPEHWNALVNMGEALVMSSTIRHVVEDANRYFRRALETRPDYLPTWKWLVHTELLLGNEARAEKALKHILTMAPSDEFAQYWLHQIHQARVGKRSAAE
ncbi:MAG: hypothetical protein DRP01_10215 [Archaeoglobales archaeon]|nr:MAG: hypothetical protein DRP01_10215 [Archaeoglobales archaeon]